MSARPNVLVILTDQQQHPPPYPMAAACAPSRTSLLTGHYPSLHGVTQTDGIAKSAAGAQPLCEPDDAEQRVVVRVQEDGETKPRSGADAVHHRR